MEISAGKGKDVRTRAAPGEQQRRQRQGPLKWRTAGPRCRPHWSPQTVLRFRGPPLLRWRQWTRITRARRRRPDWRLLLLVLTTFTAACPRSARGAPPGRGPWDWWMNCRIGTLRPWARTTPATEYRTRACQSTTRACISTVECTTTRSAEGRADSSTVTSTTASAWTAWFTPGTGPSYRSRSEGTREHHTQEKHMCTQQAGWQRLSMNTPPEAVLRLSSPALCWLEPAGKSNQKTALVFFLTLKFATNAKNTRRLRTTGHFCFSVFYTCFTFMAVLTEAFTSSSPSRSAASRIC